jgi:hypothetical protein
MLQMFCRPDDNDSELDPEARPTIRRLDQDPFYEDEETSDDDVQAEEHDKWVALEEAHERELAEDEEEEP